MLNVSLLLFFRSSVTSQAKFRHEAPPRSGEPLGPRARSGAARRIYDSCTAVEGYLGKLFADFSLVLADCKQLYFQSFMSQKSCGVASGLRATLQSGRIRWRPRWVSRRRRTQ